MFYLALGYFISYLPYAVLAEALSSAIVPDIDRPVGGMVLLSAAALGQLVVRARSGHRVMVTAAGVEADPPGAAMADFADAVLRDAGVLPRRDRPRQPGPELCQRAEAIQQAVRARPVEQFL